MKKIQVLLFVLFPLISLQAQRLGVFSAETGKYINSLGQEKRYPYTSVINYFGFIDSTWVPTDTLISTTKGNLLDRKVYSLCFNLPDTVHEIGLRMISPVPSEVYPGAGDIVEKGFYDYRKIHHTYFDPCIHLDQEYNIIYIVSPDSEQVSWYRMIIGDNDNSDEVFVQPSGKKNNSLLRILSDSTTNLNPGNYRVLISFPENQKIEGSFILQLGSTVTLPKMKIYRKP